MFRSLHNSNYEICPNPFFLPRKNIEIFSNTPYPIRTRRSSPTLLFLCSFSRDRNFCQIYVIYLREDDPREWIIIIWIKKCFRKTVLFCKLSPSRFYLNIHFYPRKNLFPHFLWASSVGLHSNFLQDFFILSSYYEISPKGLVSNCECIKMPTLDFYSNWKTGLRFLYYRFRS